MRTAGYQSGNFPHHLRQKLSPVIAQYFSRETYSKENPHQCFSYGFCIDFLKRNGFRKSSGIVCHCKYVSLATIGHWVKRANQVDCHFIERYMYPGYRLYRRLPHTPFVDCSLANVTWLTKSSYIPEYAWSIKIGKDPITWFLNFQVSCQDAFMS